MIALIQRVSSASVTVAGQRIGAIENAVSQRLGIELVPRETDDDDDGDTAHAAAAVAAALAAGLLE